VSARPAPHTNGKVKTKQRSTEAGALTSTQLLEIYRAMMRIRVLDDRMITLQRQGRVGFYGACSGQEAATIASGYALQPRDWVFQALREQGVALMRGLGLVPLIAQVFGNSGDLTKGRQMPSHPAAKSVNHVSWSSVIGTQLPHAVGAAWAASMKGDDVVAMAYLGDGATSSADFHVAMNFAGVFKVPVIFICQNNHWSISVPTQNQTASETIAIKATAYGIPGVKVDGNDAEAVYAAASEAVQRARSGKGATLIECETYRMGAHSTSDDPTRYRDPREVDEWKKRDPIVRTFKRLVDLEVWDTQRDEELRTSLLEEVNAAIKEAEALPPPEVGTLFEDVYESESWNLAEQRAELKGSR
jgi:pyruvate dehydrogenase E1 component alpha subunit